MLLVLVQYLTIRVIADFLLQPIWNPDTSKTASKRSFIQIVNVERSQTKASVDSVPVVQEIYKVELRGGGVVEPSVSIIKPGRFVERTINMGWCFHGRPLECCCTYRIAHRRRKWFEQHGERIKISRFSSGCEI